MRPLLPTLKEKKRYVAYEVFSEKKHDFHDIKKEIDIQTKEMLGLLGKARAGIMIMDNFEKEKQKGIIKVNNRYVNELKSSLMMVEKINNEKAMIKSLGTSGILKKAKAKYLN